jgi:hypothetical protein
VDRKFLFTSFPLLHYLSFSRSGFLHVFFSSQQREREKKIWSVSRLTFLSAFHFKDPKTATRLLQIIIDWFVCCVTYQPVICLTGVRRDMRTRLDGNTFEDGICTWHIPKANTPGQLLWNFGSRALFSKGHHLIPFSYMC